MSKGQKVWVRFEGKQKYGSVIRLRIEDFPEGRQDEAFEFMKKYFIREEAFHVAAGIFYKLTFTCPVVGNQIWQVKFDPLPGFR